MISKTGRAMTAESASVCRFELELARTEVPWDERIEGTVVLRGGSRPQPVSRAVLHHIAGSSPDARPELIGETRQKEEFTVGAGEVKRFTFSVPAQPGQIFNTRHHIRAIIDVPEGESFIEALVSIVPPHRFENVAALLSKMIRLPLREWTSYSSEGVCAVFAPAGEFAETLDDVRLVWFGRGRFRTAEVIINLREHATAEYVPEGSSRARAARRRPPRPTPTRGRTRRGRPAAAGRCPFRRR
jgi:hypothetical protein